MTLLLIQNCMLKRNRDIQFLTKQYIETTGKVIGYCSKTIRYFRKAVLCETLLDSTG